MPQVNVHNLENEVVGTVDLASWWEEGVNPGLIHQAVVAARAGARRGTRSTKGRSEVSGSTRKQYRQKGTGRARRGAIRAPQIRGGGVVFGPRPRDYSKSLNRKMSRKALRGALAHKSVSGDLMVIENLNIPEGKTREMVRAMDRLGVVSALVVVPEVTEELRRAAANLAWVKVVTPERLNLYDVLAHERLIVARDALQALEGALNR